MSERNDSGIVLVAVLFTVAIMSVMVVAASTLTRSGIVSYGIEQRRLATELALRSGIESAKALIVATPPSQRAYFEGTPMVVDLGGGTQAEVSVRDAAGLPDLNRTELPLIDAMLLVSLGAAEAAELSTRIAGLRAKAAEQAMTAEAAARAKPADRAAPGREEEQQAPVIFVSADQLKALARPGSSARLPSHLTVFNPTGLVNPLAAPKEVLHAIPGFTKADLAAIEAARKNRAPRPEQGLQLLLERLKSFLAVRDPSVFIIGIRLREGPGIIARSTAAAVVQIAEQGPLPFRTLSVSGL